MVKSSVVWSIVYLISSTYPDGGFLPCFFFFFFFSSFLFLHSCHNFKPSRGCGRHSMPSKRKILPPLEVLTYADDMNKDWKGKKRIAR